MNTPLLMNKKYYYLILLTILFASCSKKQEKDILIHNFGSSVFEDIVELEGMVNSVRSVTINAPDRINAEIIFLVEDGKQVNEGDIVCVLESRELINDYEELLRDLENTKANLEKSKADLDMKYAMLQAQVKSIDAQTQIANLDSAQLKFASPNQRKITELNLRRAAIEKSKLEKKLTALESINKSQLKGLEVRISRWENRIKSAQEMIDQLTIKAPQSGLAMRGDSWYTGLKLQEGDQVESDMPIISIPDLNEMKVIIQASEASYKRINENDPVEITFDAMPGNKAWGKITRKSPIGQPVARGSKVKTFEVEASIDSSLTIPTPGLSAKCNVIVKRIKNAVVIPQLAIFDDDSTKVVYVKNKSGFEKRKIKIGASSPSEAVITSGLNGKEYISMLKPEANKIIQKKK